VDLTDRENLWDDLFQCTSPDEDEEPKAVTSPPGPPSFASSQNSVLGRGIVESVVIFIDINVICCAIVCGVNAILDEAIIKLKS
jgi:hypothetical protein